MTTRPEARGSNGHRGGSGEDPQSAGGSWSQGGARWQDAGQSCEEGSIPAGQLTGPTPKTRISGETPLH